MKIKLEMGDRLLEFERKPMSKERFKAVCCILCTVLYIATVAVSGAVIGPEVAIIMALFGLFGCGGAILAILCLD